MSTRRRGDREKHETDPLPADDEPEGRAAVAAWHELVGSNGRPSRVWFLGNRYKRRAIFRLDDAHGSGRAVIAKRCLPPTGELERLIHQGVLPRLGVSTPRLHGSIAGEDGSVWLFLEDVGADRFRPADPVQRGLAAEWLGRLHTGAPEAVGPDDLPDRGPRHYLGRLRSARQRIRTSRDNPALTRSDRADLDDLVRLLDDIESGWADVESATAGLPATLTHGDFQPKNVFLRDDIDGRRLYPVDWEEAGWGIPAPDVVPAHGPAGEAHLDLDRYGAIMRGRWPDIDDAAIRDLAQVGTLFRRLVAIDWSAGSLGFPWPDRPIAQLRIYRPELEEAFSVGLAGRRPGAGTR